MLRDTSGVPGAIRAVELGDLATASGWFTPTVHTRRLEVPWQYESLNYYFTVMTLLVADQPDRRQPH